MLQSYFSNDEVIALIDAFGLVPECLVTKDLLERVQCQLNLRRASEVMSAEEEKEAHAFLEMVMARNRRAGKKLPSFDDFSVQQRFVFENFD